MMNSEYREKIAESRERRRSEPVNIFSPDGRVALSLALRPGQTIPQMAERLGLSEPQIRLSLWALEQDQVINVRRRPGVMRNFHEVNRDALVSVHGIGDCQIGKLADSIIRPDKP